MTTALRSRLHRLVLPLLLAVSASGAEIVCEGVLGNSGEQGATLVRFGDPKDVRGMGVACDRFGSLWDRAGRGVLNRYAPDGRLLGQYRIPEATGRSDQIALVGDLLVLLLGDHLYTLPITAPPGTEAKRLGVQAECISFGSAGGSIVACFKGAVSLVDAASGAAAKMAEMDGVQAIELGPDGALYVQAGGRVHKLVHGKPTAAGWPRKGPGERMQRLGDAWFGHGWHGTIRRFAADLEPAPGVVLGGASGHFIGHLPQNSELTNGRGMARVRDGLYAVSGLGGILHLARWDAETERMTLVRRIGAVPWCRGIGLDRKGNVWWHAGSWRWDDGPDAPLRLGVNAPEFPGVAQVSMLDGDGMVAPGFLWGKPTFYRGALTGEVSAPRIERGCSLPRGVVGCAVYRRDRVLVLLTVDGAGKPYAFAIGSDGSHRRDIGAVPMSLGDDPVLPLEAWTSLAAHGDGVLFAAASGAVVEMVPDGIGWKETRRWNEWAGAEPFGSAIHVACDAGWLWVADRERHCVWAFDLSAPPPRKPAACFGTPGKAGTSLAALDRPETIAARGRRAVVYDSGNQRLVKLRLE